MVCRVALIHQDEIRTSLAIGILLSIKAAVAVLVSAGNLDTASAAMQTLNVCEDCGPIIAVVVSVEGVDM